MNEKKIGWFDLTWPLKLAVCASWASIIVYVLYFIIGMYSVSG